MSKVTELTKELKEFFEAEIPAEVKKVKKGSKFTAVTEEDPDNGIEVKALKSPIFNEKGKLTDNQYSDVWVVLVRLTKQQNILLNGDADTQDDYFWFNEKDNKWYRTNIQ